MTPRERFALLLADLRASRAAEVEMRAEGSPADSAYKQRIYAAAREAGYRGKEAPWESSAKLSDAARAACMKAKDAFLAEWQPRFDAQEAKTKAIANQLADLAPSVEIRASETSLMLRREGPDYRQGDAYARGSCRLSAKKCAAFGVRTEVVRVAPVDGGKVQLASYECRAFVAEDLDIEVLKRLHLPVREQVRLCWSWALDPRVYWPMLPHGFEEREGIDFQGRDLRLPENSGIARHDEEKLKIGKAAWEVWHYHKGPTWCGETKSWRFDLSASQHPVYGRLYPAHAVFTQRIESNLFARRTVVLGEPLLVTAPERVEWSWDDSPEERLNTIFGEPKKEIRNAVA